MALRIVYEGDEAAAKSHLPAAQNLLHKVREFVAASGAGVYSSRLVIDDRAYAFALKIGDMEAIHIFAQPITPTVPPLEPPKEFPDLLSGVVRAGWMRTDTLPPLPGQTQTRKIKFLESFRPNAATAKRLKIGTDFGDSARLAVQPHKQAFQFVSDAVKPPPDREPSQYVSIRPSNYTGAMQKLAQVLLGFGRLPPHRVHSDTPAGRATIITEGLQMVYDYRFFRTHGVAKGEDDRLWLIEIAMHTGVRAMLLPLIPDTKKLASSGSADIAAVVKEFGGLPSGDGFPVGARLEKMIEDGTVLQLLSPEELEPVYDNKPFVSSCGWAFNKDGSEAHITCWNYSTTNGMKRGYHFGIKLTIGALIEKRKPGEPIAEVEAKLLKVSDGNLYYPPEPPVTGDYPEGTPQPPFKIFEPLLDEMFDFAFDPLPGANGYPEYAGKLMCDTTIHVYFADDDQLKQVKYYYDRHTKNKYDIVTDYDFRSPPTTPWTRTEIVGVLDVAPMFYTSDIDERQEIAQQRIVTRGTGEYVGYSQGIGATGTTGGVTTDGKSLKGWALTIGGEIIDNGEMTIPDPYAAGYMRVEPVGGYIRYLRFNTYVTTEQEIGPIISSGIALPEGLRAGFIYVSYQKKMPNIFREVFGTQTMRDHHEYVVASAHTSASDLTGKAYVWKAIGFVPDKYKPFDQAVSFHDVNDLVDYGEWTSPGAAYEFVEQQVVPNATRDTANPMKGRFKTTLYTDHESGGLTLQDLTDYEEASDEWRTWYTQIKDLPKRPTVRMGVYYSAGLGERHMVYDTKLLGERDDRKYDGKLVVDQRGSELVKFNFIGVP